MTTERDQSSSGEISGVTIALLREKPARDPARDCEISSSLAIRSFDPRIVLGIKLVVIRKEQE